MQVHEKIRTLRELNNLTQEEIAEKLSISTSGYSKIERGETRLNIERLQQLADIFQVNIFDLITQSDNNIIYEINGGLGIVGFNHSSLEYNDKKQTEIERLNLIISHKEEIILQKEQEIKNLKDIILLLKDKNIKK